MNNKIKETINEVTEQIEGEAKTWLLKTQPNIKKIINKRLDKNFDEIALKVLGFTNHWGNWEIDHCNGRQGQSSVGDWLKEECTKEINKWITKNIKKLPLIPKEAIENLHKEYIDRVIYGIKEQLRKQADIKTQEIVNELINNVLKQGENNND